MFFLNINKEKGISSFDLIQKLRKRLKIKQIGHSGTLDPLASGVMQVALGKATKLLDYLPSDKIYKAEIKFGYVTETFDDEAEKIFVKNPDFSKEELIETLNTFVGKTLQIPPKYSAIKINGQKLCDVMRKNPDSKIDIKPREIEIYSIKLLEFRDDYSAKIEVSCKKGTYIRSLVNDIGEKLQTGAYMKNLIRTKAGNFDIQNSNNLEDENFNFINPIDALDIAKIEISDDEFQRIKNGLFIKNNTKFKNNLILLTKNNKLVSVSYVDFDVIKPKKFFGE